MSGLSDRLRNPSADLLYGLIAAGLILIATVVRAASATDGGAPNILCDEFIYAGIARGLSEGDGYAYRGVPLNFSYVYPLLIAPAWWAGSMETTFEIARTINAVAMSLVAVPVYLWGRRLAGPAWALVGLVLVLLMPAFAFTGLIMTENAAFTVFVAAAFAIALALERRTAAWQALALAAIVVAWATRYQSLVLVPVFFAAALLVLAFDWRAGLPRAQLRERAFRHGRVLGVLALVGAAYLLYKRVTSGTFAAALGPYADLQNNTYPFRDVIRWAVLHVAELSLAVAIVPVSALIVLAVLGFRGQSRTDAERAFVAVALSVILFVALQVGAFAASTAHWVVERYSFYAMPFLLLALVAWIGRGAPRPRVTAAAAVIVPVGLVVYLLRDFRDFLFVGSLPVNTLSLSAFRRWQVHFDGNQDHVIWAVGIAAVVAGVAFVVLPRVAALVLLPLGVAATLVAFSRPALVQTEELAKGSLALAGATPTWVDDAVGRDADVAVLVSPNPDQFTASAVQLQTEFWNRSVHRFHRVSQTEICPLPGDDLALNAATGELARVGATGTSEVSESYVVVHRGTAVHGDLIAEGGTVLGSPLALYRVKRPLRLETSTQGVFADGWMANKADFTQYAGQAPSGTVDVTVSRAAWTGPDKPGRVRISYGPPVIDEAGKVKIGKPQTVKWVIHSGASRTFRLPARSLPLRVEVEVDPTFSPADYGSADARQLGAQLSFAFVPDDKH